MTLKKSIEGLCHECGCAEMSPFLGFLGHPVPILQSQQVAEISHLLHPEIKQPDWSTQFTLTNKNEGYRWRKLATSCTL